MQPKPDHRQAALALRRLGRTYDVIAAELGVAKSSLSLWLRDLDGPSATPQGPIEGDRRLEARQLRLQGRLLKEIAAALGVSVSCAHRWTSDLPVPPGAMARAGRSADESRIMARRYWDGFLAEREAEREAVKGAAAAAVGALTERERDLVAATAYWCEGSKDKPYARRERVVFINSDPTLIRLWMKFLHRRGVPAERIQCLLSIHESADVEAATA